MVTNGRNTMQLKFPVPSFVKVFTSLSGNTTFYTDENFKINYSFLTTIKIRFLFSYFVIYPGPFDFNVFIFYNQLQ